jgi:hypothetical protein
VNENEESVGMFLFFHTKSSNLINYSTDMYWRCSCTTVVETSVSNSFEGLPYGTSS